MAMIMIRPTLRTGKLSSWLILDRESKPTKAQGMIRKMDRKAGKKPVSGGSAGMKAAVPFSEVGMTAASMITIPPSRISAPAV